MLATFGRMYAHDILVVYVAPQEAAVALFSFELSLLSKKNSKKNSRPENRLNYNMPHSHL